MALSYDVFINEPPPQDGVLPNGEPKRFSPQASTLIYGTRDAVLTDPAMTTEQARALGDWVESHGRNLTDIFITHGHGDHWFAAELLAERFGARVVATAGTIAQMHANVATRPFLWDKLYDGIPPTHVTAVTVPDNRVTLEGQERIRAGCARRSARRRRRSADRGRAGSLRRPSRRPSLSPRLPRRRRPRQWR